MSSNKLLTESTVRRFMKLANVNSLTDNFISEMYQGAGDEKPEEKEKEVKVKKEEVEETEVTLEEEQDEETLEEQMEDEEEPAGEEDMDMDMEMDMDDEPQDMDDDPEMGAADISLTEEEAQLLIDLGERLKEAMGDDDEMDMDDDDMDMDDEGPETEDEGPEMEDDEPGMADAMRQGGGGVYENQDEIVQEVLRRVTQRIVAQKLKNAN